MATPGRKHEYELQIKWTGNNGQGTANYRGYQRSYDIMAPDKPLIQGSSDPTFRGDKTKHNPEDFLVAALSACHMLSYFHVCASAGIVVTDYHDTPLGTMVETEDGAGYFTEVILKPVVTIKAGGDVTLAQQLHEKAHHLCFIANSVNFPVLCQPSIQEV